jgi:hypothetical protein
MILQNEKNDSERCQWESDARDDQVQGVLGQGVGQVAGWGQGLASGRQREGEKSRVEA